jgi:DNA-directed RNA polymerase III subunit RPC4
MTASGPFALGPTAMSNTSNRRIEQRSNYTTPVAPGSTPAAGLSHAIIPILKVDKGKSKAESRNADEGDERESYSDADEGVEIIDMEDVKGMDWMAPESLPKVKNEGKKAKERRLAKKGSNKSYSLKGKGELPP